MSSTSRNSSENNANLYDTLISKLLQVKPSESVINISRSTNKMWSSAELILKTILYFATETYKWEEKEESKACMFLFGMLLVIFCPILTFSALYDFTLLFLIKILIPIASVVLMLCVGLPTIAIMKWVYNSYKFLYTVTLQFCTKGTTALIGQDVRTIIYKKEKNIKILPGTYQFIGDKFCRNTPFKEYEKFEEPTLEL